MDGLVKFFMETHKLLFITLILTNFAAGSYGYASNKRKLFAFTKPVYNATVPEKAFRGLVKSVDMMGMWLNPETQDASYSVVEGGERFQISRKLVGDFVFLQLHSRSHISDREVKIRAVSTNREKVVFCTVYVHVQDVNDFDPLFPPSPYAVTIGEDTKIGTTIAQVQAIDSDRDPENTRIYYSFADLTSNNFAIDPTTGAVTLTALVSHDTQVVHSLTIRAIDRKAALSGSRNPKETTLTVTVRTVNYHAPVIEVHYPGSRNIGEVEDGGSRGGQVCAILKVLDPDSGRHGRTLVPRVTRSNVGDVFEILPPEKENEYHLVFRQHVTYVPPVDGILNITVEVSDMGVPPKHSSNYVILKVYDRQALVPVFDSNSFHFTVSESYPVFTQVGFTPATVQDSKKSQTVRYAIADGNEGGAFAISENTSLITVASRLDRNVKREYRLIVSATNTNLVEGIAKATTSVIVSIEDANNHDPIFSETSYATEIAENAPPYSVVIRVFADDQDIGLNASVIYSLVDATKLPFAISPFNGTIYTTEPLDYDVMSNDVFKLRVRASDRGTPFNRKSESYIKVKVTNNNDNPPVFNNVDCTVDVPVYSVEGTEVLQLSPVDIDRNRVTCAIHSGDREMFLVDPSTCSVSCTSAFQRVKVGTEFFMKIVVSDGKFTSSPVDVNITVTSGNKVSKLCRETGALARFEESLNNQILRLAEKETTVNIYRTSQIPNQHTPKLLPPGTPRQIKVAENVALGSVLVEIRAADVDNGFNGKLCFTIISGNEDSCFFINNQNGDVKLVRPLDRERTSEYQLIVEVSDLGIPTKTIQVQINLIITDVNDNPPVFDNSLYTFELDEDVPIGYAIENNVHAVDRDEGQNAMVRYRLPPSIASNKFSIHPITGQINVTGSLDREEVSEYRFNVIVTDGAPAQALSSSAEVVIRVSDVNDNPPQFYRSLNRVRISEDLPEGSIIFRLQAHDPDSKENGVITYSLSDGLSNRHSSTPKFRVDARTGAIRLAEKLDYRMQNRYNITARARDQGHLVSTCFVEVDVLAVNRNFYAPYFDFWYIRTQVSEDTGIGTPIYTITATDEDETNPEKEIYYSFVDGTGLGIFTINEDTGTITTLQTLDRETGRFYWLTVVAKDRAAVPLAGHTFLLVEVTDVNDNAPYVSKPIYFVSIAENTPFGSKVTKINATDRDAGPGEHLTYSIREDHSYFTIEPDTGIVRTNKQKLDRERARPSNLTFEVSISDAGTPSLSTNVTIVVNLTDENDNSPKFLPDVESILNLPARDRTGVPFPIAKVTAHDKDRGLNADIDYKLLSSKSRFNIHPKTGVISTDQAFQEGTRNVLKVVAYDQGASQLESKVKRVEIEWGPPAPRNGNAPVFIDSDLQEPTVYHEHVDVAFEQNPRPDDSSRFLRPIRASDVDSDRVWFYLAAGNEGEMFHINSQNGFLLVTGHPDAEKRDFYNLTIEATDGYNSAFAKVSVLIADVNDHRPIFDKELYRASVLENSPPNTFVIQVRATDGDRTLRNRDLIYSIRDSVDPASSSKFRITSGGFIYTTVGLDREIQREHILTIEVNDQGAPGLLQGYCRVIIAVDDANEYPPHFTAVRYSAIVMTGVADAQVGADDSIGKVALRVRATDQDHGENARIIYSISAGNINGLWRINPSTGEIYSTRALITDDDASAFQSSFTVRATDGAVEPLTDTAEVRIDIRPRDDTPPRFETGEMMASVPENLPRKSFVTMVTASALSGVTYNISAENDDGTFVINPNSGVLSLEALLDREKRSSYDLTVRAINAEGKYSEAHIKIKVDDVNDNKPIFNPSVYLGKVFESHRSSASSPVVDENDIPLQVKAYDDDAGDNSRISYRLMDAAEEVLRRFTVDPTSGLIRTLPGTGLFDYETVKKYSFQVQAYDLGSPRRYSSNIAVVTIYVKDANDTLPTFTKPHYKLQLMLPTCEDAVVSRETRVSNDILSQLRVGQVTYSISDESNDTPFAIDSHSGAISVADASTLSDDEEFLLSLSVSDGRKTAYSKATILVRSISPRHRLTFSHDTYRGVVTENSNKKMDIAVVEVRGVKLDEHLHFAIVNPTPFFSVGSTSGVISTTGIPVDREQKAAYELLIEATDVQSSGSRRRTLLRRGRCVVRVIVVDVNDNPPQFVKVPYYATVQVDATPGTVVKQVLAMDADDNKNKDVRYSLGEKYTDLFEIDAVEGILTLRSTPADIVGGSNNKFNVTLFASDMGTPKLTGKTVLRVSVVNRATPIFTQPFYGGFGIPEDAQSHSVITTDIRASSPEGSDVFYTIEDGDPLGQFDIDFVGGTLTSLGCLDYEAKSRYRLRVRARDAQSRAFADVDVDVVVIDVNDNAPTFSKSSYVKRLPETARVGNTVVKLDAFDLDSGENGHIRYTVVKDDSSHESYFLLDPDTGMVLTARGLDHEVLSELSFVVRATDSGTPMRYADVAVTLFVDDINDNRPVFEKDIYECRINTNVLPGHFVGKVFAWDPDTTDRDNLVYSIDSTTSSANMLTIAQDTGIVTASEFAHLTTDQPIIHVNVSVTDGVFSSSAKLTIYVASDDTSPKQLAFEHNMYNISVVEGNTPGMKLGQVNAAGSGVTYSLDTSTKYSDAFSINPTTGNIYTAGVVDREEFCHDDDAIIPFHVIAIDSKGFIARCVVHAQVVDVNDNFPIFTQDNYSAVVILSKASINDFVIKVEALDADSGKNGTVVYSWDEDASNAKRFFNINFDTGDITIRERPRNLGNVKTLNFYVRASDRGSPLSESSLVGVSIYLASDNDPVPKFDQDEWRLSILENNIVGSTVVNVHATVSGTSRLTYALAQRYITDEEYESLSAGNATVTRPTFSIDPVSGVITTARVLDREDKRRYVLTVLAYTETTPELVASAKIFVDVTDENDNNPLFTSSDYRCSVFENAPAGTELVQVEAYDRDEGVFGDISFSLVDAADGSQLKFAIDSKTGILRTLVSLDRESTSDYVVTVKATDGGNEITSRHTICQVIVQVIDVNDSPPVFSKSEFSVHILESASVGQRTLKFISVTDNDIWSDSSLQLFITHGDLDGQFEVVQKRSMSDENTLNAGLRLLKNLDRDRKSLYALTILATDGLHSNTAHVQVLVNDTNDNAPACRQLSYRGSVREDAASRTSILKVSSYDADAGDYGTVVYTLAGEGSNLFHLDPRTGVLRTDKALDRETTDEYKFIATSTDGGGLSCVSEILLSVEDVNDNPPQFVASSLRASARENTPINSLLHRVVARDNDKGTNGTFDFTLLDDINGQFSIEPHSGVIILKKLLDRETVSFHELRIMATDHGPEQRLSSRALFRLQVLDVNDNPPIFQQTQYETFMRENAASGHVVTQVIAESLDAGANAKLRYSITQGNEHRKFYINQNSGQVTLASKVDYERDQSYVLTISASDRSENPLSGDCTLRIVVVDVNDNAPEFTLASNEIPISEDAEVGRLVTLLSATDSDSGEAGNVTYSLSSKDNMPFKIDSFSGRLTVAFPGLDYELKRSYEVTVIATDQGVPPLATQISILINIKDVNDNRPRVAVTAPVFGSVDGIVCSSVSANCSVYVHEDSTGSMIDGVVRLNATDEDGEGNAGPFSFRILSGNEAGEFYLDEDNRVKSRHPLQLDDMYGRRNRQTLIHQLMIEVTDAGNPLALSSQPPLLLNVIVIKESRYAPVLQPHQIEINIHNNQFEKGLISQRLYATDQDPFDEDRLRFSLALPDDFENFIIDPLSGSITAETSLTEGTYNVSVRVSDGSRFTSSSVPITLTRITRQALENSASISFRGIPDLEGYLTLYHVRFVDILEDNLPNGFNRRRDLLIISLQLVDNIVEVLFAIRKPPSARSSREFYRSKSLRNILGTNRDFIGDKLRVQVDDIQGTACAPEECLFGSCLQMPELMPGTSVVPLIPVTSRGQSIVTSRFQRRQSCVCSRGTFGPKCQEVCSEGNNPCSKHQTCKVDESEPEGYECVYPTRPKRVMTFSGRSYIHYQREKAQSALLSIKFRLRTYQSNSTIFHATGPRHFARLESSNGRLSFTFDCGGGIRTMWRDVSVGDGLWHDVQINRPNDRSTEACAFNLTVGNIAVIDEAVGGDKHLEFASITFGGKDYSSRSTRSSLGDEKSSEIEQGFRGCLQNVELNGAPLPSPSSSSVISGIRIAAQIDITNSCHNSMIDMGACTNSPCVNGGICVPFSGGSYQCNCPVNFDGDICEKPDPCGPMPCQNKGICLSDGDGIRCTCNKGFSGIHCEKPSACLARSQCLHGGTCIEIAGTSPSCHCPAEWTGQQCEIDIDECSISIGIETCGSTGNCFNFDGGFACNCSLENEKDQDQNCPSKDEFAQSRVPLWILGVGVGAILVVIVIVVVCYKKRRKNGKDYQAGRRSKRSQSENYENDSDGAESRPAIPQRPVEYQRTSRDSFKMTSLKSEDQEQRNLPTCRVRPHFAPAMSASDNDSIKKPTSPWSDHGTAKQLNESTQSALHGYPPSRKVSDQSFVDQQTYDWDITDWKPHGSGVVCPTVASVSYDRQTGRCHSEVPSSPESRRSLLSVSTNRSRRSHRSDALPGYYSNNSKLFREKQLRRMIEATPDFRAPLPQQDKRRLRMMLNQLKDQPLPADLQSLGMDSCGSSVRSSSRDQHPTIHNDSLPHSYHDPRFSPNFSICVGDDCSQNFSDDEYEDTNIEGSKLQSYQGHVTRDNLGALTFEKPSVSDSDSNPRSPASECLPPPPTEQELRVLKEDVALVDNPLLSSESKSFSSLLASPFKVDMPTPAAARSTKFHPDQYLLRHYNTSDVSEASESAPGSSYSLNQHYGASGYHGSGPYPYERPCHATNEIPAPPVRHDSVKLELSSLSEAEDDDQAVNNENRLHKKTHHSFHGRSSSKPKARRRHKKRLERERHRRQHHSDAISSMELLSLQSSMKGQLVIDGNNSGHIQSSTVV